MRILLAGSYYDHFLEGHYRDHPGLADRPYSEQLDSLLAAKFGPGDSLSRHLRARGHAAADLILNADPLQQRWAAEHRTSLRHALSGAAGLPERLGVKGRELLRHRIAWAQISEFEPDVLYLHDLWFFWPAELRRLRGRGITVVGQIASTAPPDPVLRLYDLLISSFPHFVERFRGLGVRSEYLPLAFDEAILDRLRERGTDPAPNSARGHQVSFIGGLDPQVHPRRVELLERVCDVAELDIWGYGVEALRPDSPIRTRYQGPVWGLEMYSVLADSKLVINAHIDDAAGFANNLRLFETTGCGALLVTEAAPNLGDLFQPGAEVATYEGPEDLVEEVRRQLGDDPGRVAIAAAGQRRTLAEHTYRRRSAELEALLTRFHSLS